MTPLTSLPEPIAEYFRASTAHDTDAAVATFTPDATVVDDGSSHTGQSEIRAWRDQTSSEFEYTTTILGVVSDTGDEHVVTAEVAGDFPGSPVRLGFGFTLSGDHIAALVIAPR